MGDILKLGESRVVITADASDSWKITVSPSLNRFWFLYKNAMVESFILSATIATAPLSTPISSYPIINSLVVVDWVTIEPKAALGQDAASVSADS